MKYVLDNNVVFAIHEDSQDITGLYPGMTIWQTNEEHDLGELVTVTYSMADYDRAVEEHLLAERTARGYTTREPSDYAGSAVPRWAQDAQDWISHRDAVMLYALQVMNNYAQTGVAPSLPQFKAALPDITWTYSEE